MTILNLSQLVDTSLSASVRTSTLQRHRAARRVATAALSVTDAAALLACLGLTAEEGLRPAQDQPEPERKP